MHRKSFIFAAAAFAGVASSAGAAPISIGMSLTYSENFDGLPTTTPSPSPFSTTTGTAADVTGAPGFVATRVSGSATTALPFVVSDGSGNTGGIQSLGVASNAERALGTLASGTNIPAFGAQFVNNSGMTITAFALAYNSEQYRSASNSSVTAIGIPNDIIFAYGTDGTLGTTAAGTFLTDTTLIPVTSGDLISTASGTSAAVVTNNATVPATITTPKTVAISGLALAPGQSLFIRFTDTNDVGNDAAIGIDDFTIQATTTAPEPASVGLIAVGAVSLMARRRKV